MSSCCPSPDVLSNLKASSLLTETTHDLGNVDLGHSVYDRILRRLRPWSHGQRPLQGRKQSIERWRAFYGFWQERWRLVETPTQMKLAQAVSEASWRGLQRVVEAPAKRFK
jgi:hypothetical protein